MNEYYSVFGIRKFFMNEYIRYSVFGQIHYSVQLWYFAPQEFYTEFFFVEGKSLGKETGTAGPKIQTPGGTVRTPTQTMTTR